MNLVEVFVEENCGACEAVLKILEGISVELSFTKKIFRRENDGEEFHSRGVVIVPATFINRKLAFYGEFSRRDFGYHFERYGTKS